MFRRILLILLFPFTIIQVDAATPKDTIATKVYIQALEKRIQKLEESSGQDQITQERLHLVNDKIDNLQGETDRSMTGIANQLAASTDYLTKWGYIFGLVGVFLGIYVTWMLNRASKNMAVTKETLTATKRTLTESKAILEIQNTTKNEVLQIQKIIDQDIKSLYLKLQDEEAIYFIDEIKNDPTKMYSLYDRLMGLNLKEDHYIRMVDFIITYTPPGMREFRSDHSMFNIILHKFPKRWLSDKQLKEHFLKLDNLDALARRFSHERTELIDNLCDYYNETTPEPIDYQVGSLLLEAAFIHSNELRHRVPIELYNLLPDVKLTKLVYESLKNKEQRFAMYEALIGNHCGLKFWQNLHAEYANDVSNTPVQIELLDRCKREYENTIEEEKVSSRINLASI